jgi:uncharacterized membrane protein
MESLFADAPKNRRTEELKEEMIQNLTEKYRDLLAGGKPADVAYEITITSIGDVSELINDLEESYMRDPIEERRAQQKSALITAIAIMLYILSPLAVIISAMVRGGSVLAGLILLFVMVATATGMLIYNGMTRPRYVRSDDTMVEEFREWQSEKTAMRSVRRQITGAVWSIAVVLYFVISFTFGIWHVSWVIFIIAIAVDQLIRAFMSLKDYQ